jgi:hypothetical protein
MNIDVQAAQLTSKRMLDKEGDKRKMKDVTNKNAAT